MPAPHRRVPAPQDIHVRAITAGDAPRLAEAFAGFSDRTRYLRFLGPKPRLSSAELRYLTDVDQHRHVALAAVDPVDGSFVGIARYAMAPDEAEAADVAVVIADAWHGRGVGTRLMRELVARAAANGIVRLTGTTLHDNPAARALLRRVGFRTRSIGGGLIDLELRAAAGSGRVALRAAGARSSPPRSRGPSAAPRSRARRAAARWPARRPRRPARTRPRWPSTAWSSR